MSPSKTSLTGRRIGYIKAQGYFHLPDGEVTDLAFGNRFAYILCGTMLTVGVLMANIPILAAMATIAFLSVILPNHLFDYPYNHIIRHILHKPKLPPRSKQLKFACSIATLWISVTTYLFYTGLVVAGYVMGSFLLSVVFILVTTDFCIPSYIYNLIFTAENVRSRDQY